MSWVINNWWLLFWHVVWVISLRMKKPSWTEKFFLIKSVQRVFNHLISQELVLKLESKSVIIRHKVSMRFQDKINGASIWFSLNLKLKSNREFEELCSVDIQLTVRTDTHVESIHSTFVNLNLTCISKTDSWNIGSGNVHVCEWREHFVKITCVELEHSWLPKITVQLCVDLFVLYCVSEHVFVESVWDKLLAASVNLRIER